MGDGGIAPCIQKKMWITLLVIHTMMWITIDGILRSLPFLLPEAPGRSPARGWFRRWVIPLRLLFQKRATRSAADRLAVMAAPHFAGEGRRPGYEDKR